MDKYRSSKRKLAILRKNLADRERKLREFREAQERKAKAKKIILVSAMLASVGVVVYFML